MSGMLVITPGHDKSCLSKGREPADPVAKRGQNGAQDALIFSSFLRLSGETLCLRLILVADWKHLMVNVGTSTSTLLKGAGWPRDGLGGVWEPKWGLGIMWNDPWHFPCMPLQGSVRIILLEISYFTKEQEKYTSVLDSESFIKMDFRSPVCASVIPLTKGRSQISSTG